MLEPPHDQTFVTVGGAEARLDTRLLVNGVIARRLADAPNYLLLPSDAADPEWLPLSDQGVRLALPLRVGNQLIGIYGCGLPQRGRLYSERVINVLLMLAPSVASALENARAYTKIARLNRELREVQNKLLLKEKEAQLLSSGKTPPPADTAESQLARDKLLERSGRNAGEEAIRGKSTPPPMNSDVMIVQVIGGRVALRSGPSPDDAEVISVAKGTQLTVEERTGDWYRVIAPNSTRAYVRADLVRVINDPQASGADNPPVRRPGPSAARPPKKRALKTVAEDPNMVPFGEVNPGTPSGDKIDKAFEQLKGGLGEKPTTPQVLQ